MRALKPALQYSQGRSFVWSGASLVNCFAEKADGDKSEDFAVLVTPGLTLWANVGTGPIRGSMTVAGVLYVVSGGTLYSVAAGGAETALGTIAGSGPVRLAANYTELCIAAGGVGYVYSGGVLQTPTPFSVSDVIYADGYMLWVVEDSEQFFISSLDNALVYDAADIASVEGAPDNIVGVISNHREILFFGEGTTELFYDSGAADFPFVRQGNAFLERGCFDQNSIVKMDNSINFVGEDRIVYTLNGYQPQRISTHAIEYALRNATYVNAWTYAQEGHKFYVIECENGTFCFDHATGAWHNRASWQSDFYRANGAIEAYGLMLLTDRTSGNLYTASLDVFTENGDPIAVDIELPSIEAGRARATMQAFEVVFEVGAGDATTPDPQVMLTYSDDGGHRWSNELWRSLGQLGGYRTRAIWRKLGQFRSRTMWLRITDPVRRLMVSYWADIV